MESPPLKYHQMPILVRRQLPWVSVLLSLCYQRPQVQVVHLRWQALVVERCG